MAKSENQKLKLLYLNRILHEQTDDQHRLNAEQLIAALDAYDIMAERKSIYGDILALQDFGVDIVAQKGRGAGYYVASRDFELAELKLLVDAIQSSRFITERKSNELIGKVAALTSQYEARTLQRQVYVAGRNKTLNEGIYYNVDKIHSAISLNHKISFRYFEWKLDFSTTQKVVKQYRHDGARYVISPWALTWDDENYYMVGFDTEADRIKHYRVDKMENIEELTDRRDGRDHFEQFDMASYTQKFFGMFSGEERSVSLRCRNSFISVIRDRFGSDAFLRPDPESADHFRATVRVAVSPQFFGWIAGLGGGVAIHEPEDVREQFSEHLKNVTQAL